MSAKLSLRPLITLSGSAVMVRCCEHGKEEKSNLALINGVVAGI